MEEILASIRRIIAEDDASKPAKPPETAAPPKPSSVVAPPPSRPPPVPPKAATPPPAPKPAAPSMPASNSQEDIDAMLAELDVSKAVPKPPGADVFDLTEAMAAPAPAPTFRTIDGTSDVAFSNKPAPPLDRGLISSETIAAVDSAFNTLAHTIIGQNARTLEDLVKEMLRPMLKSWLDDNLPGLVERIVRAEIERVSRGR